VGVDYFANEKQAHRKFSYASHLEIQLETIRIIQSRPANMCEIGEK
jgi:hypothetical protein